MASEENPNKYVSIFATMELPESIANSPAYTDRDVTVYDLIREVRG